METEQTAAREEARGRKRLPMLNLRPLTLVCSALCFGIFLYGRIRFGGLVPSDFFFLAVIAFLLYPLNAKRRVALISVFVLSAALGALAIHLYAERFFRKPMQGELTGTVVSVLQSGGYVSAILSDLSLDGEALAGKCAVTAENSLAPGEKISFRANLTPVRASDNDFRWRFSENIRYSAKAERFERVGRSRNPFYRLRAALYSRLQAGMGEAAGIAYALLTGDANSMDEGFLFLTRRGGIAHIFAVSGLHIGILYGAVSLLFRPLGRRRVLPAAGAAFVYAMFCGFSISSVRAAIMCAVVAFCRLRGLKSDLLETISFAGILILLFFPAEWFSAGFRLSFGACLGLALFSGDLRRAFSRLSLPRGLADYLSAALAVQITLLPIQLEAFGYASILGILLNLIVIPVMPALFLGLLIGAVCTLIVPMFSFLLAPGKAVLTLLEMLFGVLDPPVLTGFSLGSAATIFLLGGLFLSGKTRLRARSRTLTACGLALLLAVTLVGGNVVLSGCTVEVYSDGEASCALISTRRERVLVLGEGTALSNCRDFLNGTYGGTLDAVFVLSDDEAPAIGVAAALNPERVFAFEEIETGLMRPIEWGDARLGELEFRYEGRTKLLLFAEGVCVEFEFGGRAVLGADLSLPEQGGRSKYAIAAGKVRTLS